MIGKETSGKSQGSNRAQEENRRTEDRSTRCKSQTEGTKRTAETAVEELDPRVEESPKKTSPFSHVPETPPAGWKLW